MIEEDNLPSPEDSELTANALKAMAHPLRWRILCVLGDDEMAVNELVERIGTSQSNISQHLELLKRKHILVSRREANRVFYRIKNSQLLLLIGNMSEVLCKTNLE
ncbi:MAG: metalloregulator ArsR/SmtB family transcription factor [Gammaproteobacteria bacterium]|nr:metalloregulator ArsR/SmtB family transcription factor [Gammaproteobacteria bacterium]